MTPVVEVVESVPVVGAVVEHTGLGEVATGVADGLDTTVSTAVGVAAPVGPVIPNPPLTGVDVIVDALTPSPVAPALPGVVLPVPLLAVGEETAGIGGIATSSSSRAPAAVEYAAWSPPHASAARFGAPQGSAASATEAPAHQSPAGGGAPAGPGLATPSNSSAGANGAGGGVAGLAHEDAHSSIHDFTTLRTTTDDALPGAPVFDTDVSPD